MTKMTNWIWTNYKGDIFDLTNVKTLTIGETALAMHCSTRHVHRLLKQGDLKPIIRISPKRTLIYQCAIAEFYAKKLNA